MITSTTRTIQKTKISTILQRIAERDKSAVEDCIDTYGNFIWALAMKYTASRAEAETAAEEIFTDIWQYAERARNTTAIEEKLIALIALRRLVNASQPAKQNFTKVMDVSK